VSIGGGVVLDGAGFEVVRGESSIGRTVAELEDETRAEEWL
jgi:hypothetical protein